jgi:hypothetical protein
MTIARSTHTLARTTNRAAFLALTCASWTSAQAVVTHFFNSSQVATTVTNGVTSDTISSNGYLFTYTRDKLFTGGTGTIIGRSVLTPWPIGVEAQAVTTPPPGITDYAARMTISRVDGGVFDIVSFTSRLWANTAATGAALEIMPLVNGEDAFPDPVFFDMSGYYSQSFSYNSSPNPWGSTSTLTGFDTYKVALFVDFAFTDLVLNDASVPLCPADLTGDLAVDINDLLSFLNAFEAGQSTADLDNGSSTGTPDGAVDINDLLFFLIHFEAGC